MKNVTVFLMVQNKMTEYKLGRSIAQIVPFQVTKQIVEQKDKIPFKVIIAVSHDWYVPTDRYNNHLAD